MVRALARPAARAALLPAVALALVLTATACKGGRHAGAAVGAGVPGQTAVGVAAPGEGATTTTAPAAPGAGQKESGESAAQSVPGEGAASDVKLLEAGSAPRRPLRLGPDEGATQTVTLRMKTRLRMEMGGAELPGTAIPTVIVLLATKVLDVSDEGAIRYRVEIEDTSTLAGPDVPRSSLDGVERTLEALRQFSATGVLTARGFTREVEFDLPAGADPLARQTLVSMQRSLRELSAPFPEEPVGIGARWEYPSVVELSGMELVQVATYELAERSEEGWTLTVDVTQSAKPGGFAAPDMPPGVEVELTSLSSRGEGSTTYRRDALLPVSSELDMATTLAMRVSQGEATERVRMSMDVEIDLGPRAEEQPREKN